ncbi:MAG: stage II sporulation protein M [Bacteroidetes bacterium]|nr:stage II sporulation protein M [Bacteroidota bacterium]
MREGYFIKKNKERWQRYAESTEDPDEVAKRFTYLVDDLSYAKTFYPSSNTVKYINSLAAKIFLSIYKNKKESRNRLITFWTAELPLIIRRHHKVLLYTFIFFAVFVAIGVFSAWQDQTFIRAILGDRYVDMTEQNIARGEPFGVYNSENELIMFVEIAFNNILVSFICFASGIFISIGTIYFLFRNSLMLGVFEYMFFQKGMGFKSILVVSTHGTLEISALVIACTAGLIMGNSILFPKSYTRMQSLMAATKDAVKIVISLVPIFITAAFFEGFVTRHTGMPVWLNLIVLGGSLLFVVWYYIIYPIKVSKRQHAPEIE